MSSAGIARRPAAHPEQHATDRVAIFVVLITLLLAAGSFAVAYEVGRAKHRGADRPESAPTVFHVAAADSSIPTGLGGSPPINIAVPPPPKPSASEREQAQSNIPLLTTTPSSTSTTVTPSVSSTEETSTATEAPSSTTPPSGSSSKGSSGGSSSGGSGAGFDSSG
ncbi:MAG TPA: hypothetical protein VGG08_08905 [Solirubrobacteraceae bacterium]|jgi:uncharacterized membrane protein YgcG